MFGILSSLTKATIGVALTPVAILADVVTLPASAEDPYAGPFDKTAKLFDNIAENFNKALEVE